MVSASNTPPTTPGDNSAPVTAEDLSELCQNLLDSLQRHNQDLRDFIIRLMGEGVSPQIKTALSKRPAKVEYLMIFEALASESTPTRSGSVGPAMPDQSSGQKRMYAYSRTTVSKRVIPKREKSSPDSQGIPPASPNSKHISRAAKNSADLGFGPAS